MSLSPGVEFLLRIGGALTYIALGMLAFGHIVPNAPWFAFLIAFFLFMLSSTFLFNRDLIARIRRIPFDEYVAELEKKGKVTRETIRSRRAIYFDDIRTSCAVYLLDVPDAGLLCLYGQYLYEWSPIDDDPKLNQPRMFPCTEFDVVKRRNGEVLTLYLRGDVFEPEILSPPTKLLGKLNFPLEDGVFIPGKSFEEARYALTQIG